MDSRTDASTVERLVHRVLSLLNVGRATLATQQGKTPTAQVKFLGTARGGPEIRDGIPDMQLYGFASAPLAGCDYAVGFLSGDKTKGVAIASNDRRFRPANLVPGESIVYDNLGRTIYLSKNGIVVNGNGSPITVQGDLVVQGKITASGDIAGNGISLDNHIHSNGNNGGDTTAPVSSNG